MTEYKSFFRATLDAVMKSYEDPNERATIEARMMELTSTKREEVNATKTDVPMPKLWHDL